MYICTKIPNETNSKNIDNARFCQESFDCLENYFKKQNTQQDAIRSLIITTGRSFGEIGDKLMFMGALSIHGVCFAKTIHPNLPLKIKRQTKNQSEMDSS